MNVGDRVVVSGMTNFCTGETILSRGTITRKYPDNTYKFCSDNGDWALISENCCILEKEFDKGGTGGGGWGFPYTKHLYAKDLNEFNKSCFAESSEHKDSFMNEISW